MRKAGKKQAQETAELLEKMHGEIKKALERQNPALAMELLEQCQSGAIALGTAIEAEEGEGFPTVRLLEDYCERLYRLYETIRESAATDTRKRHRELQKSLIQIENSIKNEIPVRREVVFLPYKASMWDSLESVWKAAEEDPDCDAYVIPIPYYDRGPDGSLQAKHYEGELYPDTVPITRYDAYDFQKRQPDMIFIHNPYDECNYVTSVHPFFYSVNLKKFTEQLIYISYFILNEIDPDNKEAVEGMKHFCTLPGVLHADKTIVQSEAMRHIYVDVLTEFTKGTAADRAYWEKRILGLGSPKLDKVTHTKREEIEIPPEWLPIINKEDGSRKKVIFYNTGLSALLQHEEKMLVKMRDVFRIFKENREEVALLWRPHPLIEATLKSMRPELWEAYQEILKQYREEGWGIYDDTADLNRAIALADGYYGDWSSVVPLCKEAGVPVMIEDVEVVEG